MSFRPLQGKGQHQTPQELLSNNFKGVIRDLLHYLNGNGNHDVDLDYVTYRLDWLISLCTRFGDHLNNEESFLGYLLDAQEFLCDISDSQLQNTFHNFGTELDVVTGAHNSASSCGRPKLNISKEQIELFVDYGFKATDIAKMLCVSAKTIHRRLHEYNLSIKNSYASLSDPELDDICHRNQFAVQKLWVQSNARSSSCKRF